MSKNQMISEWDTRYHKDENKVMRARNWNLWILRLLHKRLDPSDKTTIQAHPDGSGILRDYYVSNPYVQNKIGSGSFTAVSPILEDNENHRFVYKGIVGGANNAIGILQSNVPLSEIVADVNGNITLHEMLSISNALPVCTEYYKMIGETLDPIKGGTSYFGKSEFALGTIVKHSNGKYSFNNNIDKDVERLMEKEREENKRVQAMKEKDAIELEVAGLTVAKQDCWLKQDRGVKFAGINSDALYYEFAPKKPIKTDDGMHIYIGDLSIGKTVIQKREEGTKSEIKMISPYVFENVALWTENKSLIEYFLNYKFKGLNLKLGSTFSLGNANKQTTGDGDKPAIIGGIGLNREGECITLSQVPKSVEAVLEQYTYSQEKQQNGEKTSNLIDLWEYRE